MLIVCLLRSSRRTERYFSDKSFWQTLVCNVTVLQYPKIWFSQFFQEQILIYSSQENRNYIYFSFFLSFLLSFFLSFLLLVLLFVCLFYLFVYLFDYIIDHTIFCLFSFLNFNLIWLTFIGACYNLLVHNNGYEISLFHYIRLYNVIKFNKVL